MRQLDLSAKRPTHNRHHHSDHSPDNVGVQNHPIREGSSPSSECVFFFQIFSVELDGQKEQLTIRRVLEYPLFDLIKN